MKVQRRYLMDPWRDAFLLQLRMRDVRGPFIGEAIAEVDEHCRESGLAPVEAFGDPTDYADRVAEAYRDAPDPSRRIHARTTWWQAGLMVLAMMVGVLLGLSGIDAIVHGTTAELSWGAVVGGLFLAVLVAVWVVAWDRVMRGRTWPTLVLAMVSMWVAVGSQQLWQQPALRLGGAAALVLGLAAVASVWLPWLGGRWMRGDMRRDPVLDPRTGQSRFEIPRGVRLVLWGMPVGLLVIALLVVLVPPSGH